MGVANSALKREGDLPTLESHGVGSLFGLVLTSTITCRWTIHIF